MTDLKDKILDAVKNDLEGIETALGQNLNPYLDLVNQTASHILFSGGKRIRPLLMILSARISGYKGEKDKTFSVVFEYLHAATLLHDDIVDGAALRRGKPVANSIWSNSSTVLVGDFLLARALSISAQTRLPEVIEIIAKITEYMSQGEIHQLIRKGKIDLSEDEYMDIIQHKTAVLIEGACRVGALIAGATKEKEMALSKYGINLGIAFQMVDDLLDYTSDVSTLGKAVGADLKEGKLTLPVIYSLNKAGTKDRDKMEKIIKRKNFSDDDFFTFIEMLKKYEGIKYTKKLVLEYVDNAKKSLSVFKPSITKENLLNIADYVIARKN